MSDTRTSMREFRFLDEKRKMGSLSPAEEARWTELRGLLGVQDAPVHDPAAGAGYPQQPQGYYGQDGQWYAYPANYAQPPQQQGYYGQDGQWYAAPAPYPQQPQGYYGQDGQWYPYPAGYPQQQGYDPNQGYAAYPQQGYDPNQGYAAYPQQGYDPNQAYAAGYPQQGYDPNQGYAAYPQQGYDPNQAAYDPNQGYATQAQYPGMDPNQGYADGYAQPYEPAQAPYEPAQAPYEPAQAPYEPAESPAEPAWPAAETAEAQPAPAPEPAHSGVEEVDFGALSSPPAETPAETAPAPAEPDATQSVDGDDLLEVSADEITDVEEASAPARAEELPAPVSEEAPTALAADSFDAQTEPLSTQDDVPMEEAPEPIELQADDVSLLDGDTEPAPAASAAVQPVPEEAAFQPAAEPVLEASLEEIAPEEPGPQQELQPEPVQELQPEPVLELQPEPVLELQPEPEFDTAPATPSSSDSWDSAPLALEAPAEPVFTEPAPAPEAAPLPVEADSIPEAEISLTSAEMIEEPPPTELPVMDLGQPAESFATTPILEAAPLEEPPAQPQEPYSPELPTFDVAELGAEAEPEPSAPVEADTIELTEDAIESSQPTAEAAAPIVPWETPPEPVQAPEAPAPSARPPVEDIDLSGSPEEAVPLATNADFVQPMTDSSSWQSDRSIDLSAEPPPEAVTEVIELTETSMEPPQQQPEPAPAAASDGWSAEAPVMEASALETAPPPIEIDAEWGAPAPPDNPWAEPAQPAPAAQTEWAPSTPQDTSWPASEPSASASGWDAMPTPEPEPEPQLQAQPQPERAEWAEPEPEWIKDPPREDQFDRTAEIGKLAAEDEYAPREQWPEGPSPFGAPMADLTAGTHSVRQHKADPSPFGAPMQNLSEGAELGVAAVPPAPPPPPTEAAAAEPSIDVTFDDAPPPPPAEAAEMPVVELGDVEFTEEPAPAAPAVIPMPPPPPAAAMAVSPPSRAPAQRPAAIPMPPPPPPAAHTPAPLPSRPAAPAAAMPLPSPGVARPSVAGMQAMSAAAPRPPAAPPIAAQAEEAFEELPLFDPLGVPLAASSEQTSFFVEGEHRVIIHTVEGQVKRGVIRDADLLEESIPLEQQTGFAPERIPGKRVKAIFFMLPPGARQAQAEGQKIRVTFSDGRQMAGFSKDFKSGGQGFFFIPADNRTNTARIFVYRSNVQAVAEG